MSAAAAGADLSAAMDQAIALGPGERVAVPTGLAIAIDDGFEGQVRPRSGTALKQGLTVVNAPGTIDSDYRGEVKVLLVNLSKQEVVIEPGQRVAQMVIAPVVQAEFVQVDELNDTSRGTGGFGSTGTK
jgi:dUTP pyrophosphatase